MSIFLSCKIWYKLFFFYYIKENGRYIHSNIDWYKHKSCSYLFCPHMYIQNFKRDMIIMMIFLFDYQLKKRKGNFVWLVIVVIIYLLVDISLALIYLQPSYYKLYVNFWHKSKNQGKNLTFYILLLVYQEYF